MARYRSLFERLVANTRVDGECWIWTGHAKPYPKFSRRVNGVRKTFYAHRAMLEIVSGWLFPFDEVGHYKCYNPVCINPDHLRIETPAENKSARRGYKACEGRLMPVLFPTPERELQEAADAAWDQCD